jgi:hypothetical protein
MIPTQVRGSIYSLVDPTPLASPQLVVTSPDALMLLGLDPTQVGRGAGVRESGKWEGGVAGGKQLDSEPHLCHECSSQSSSLPCQSAVVCRNLL